MSLAETFQFMIDQPLLGLAVAAILVTTLGGMLRRSAPTRPASSRASAISRWWRRCC